MQAVLEKPPVVDPTELAATTTETVTEFLKATAEAPPALATPQPPLNPGGPIPKPDGYHKLPETVEAAVAWAGTAWEWAARQSGKTAWQHEAWGKVVKGGNGQFVAVAPDENGETLHDTIATAAAGWSAPGPRSLGIAGTGEPDVEVKFPHSGGIALKEIAAFLDYCAERIIRFGWVQGAEAFGDRVCMVGALNLRGRQVARGMYSDRASALLYEATNALAGYLSQHKDAPSIISWNDAPGRTMAEVVAAFRAAAEELRGRTRFRHQESTAWSPWPVDHHLVAA